MARTGQLGNFNAVERTLAASLDRQECIVNHRPKLIFLLFITIPRDNDSRTCSDIRHPMLRSSSLLPTKRHRNIIIHLQYLET